VAFFLAESMVEKSGIPDDDGHDTHVSDQDEQDTS
jgi:hypothetical protein